MDYTFPFKPVPLPYPNDGLQPEIDNQLLEQHYNSVYKQDVLNLNGVLYYMPTIQNWSLEEITVQDITSEPVMMRNYAKFYAGSVYNHNLYFDSMCASQSTKPSGSLLDAILHRFGSVAQMKALLVDAARTMLGSGWLWLNSEHNGDVHIAVTYDNGTPLLTQLTPIFTIDGSTRI